MVIRYFPNWMQGGQRWGVSLATEAARFFEPVWLLPLVVVVLDDEEFNSRGLSTGGNCVLLSGAWGKLCSQ